MKMVEDILKYFYDIIRFGKLSDMPPISADNMVHLQNKIYVRNKIYVENKFYKVCLKRDGFVTSYFLLLGKLYSSILKMTSRMTHCEGCQSFPSHKYGGVMLRFDSSFVLSHILNILNRKVSTLTIF